MLKEQIFEAVEALRIRKCRPDRETIAHFCTRKFGVKFQEVFTELENIVDQGGLLKVEYKGSTSYRSPGQFASNSSPLLTKHSKILNSSRTSRLVITAVSELLNEHQAWNNDGIPQKELETKLISFDAERFTSGQLQTILDREIAAGNLVVSKKTSRIFPKDLFPKDADPPEETSSGRRSGARGGRRGRAAEAEAEPEAGTSKSNAEEGEEERNKDVVEKLAAAVRKTYGFAKNAGSNVAATAGGTSISPGSGNASDSSASTRTPSPNTRAATAAAGGRQSARNKRKKEVFDPSDPPPPKQRHSSPACKVCNKQVEEKKTVKGVTSSGVTEEGTLTCTVCAGQYHSDCIPAEDRPRARSASATPPAPTPPPAGGRTRSTRRSTAAAAVAVAATPPPTANARPAPWTCPGCKECDICGGGGNKAIGEEDLTNYACSNQKCDSVVTLHEGCIVGAAADARKCVKCGVGVVGPPSGSASEGRSASAEKKTPAKRGRGSPKKAAVAEKKKKTEANSIETEEEVEAPATAAPEAEAEIKENAGAAQNETQEIKMEVEPEKAEADAPAANEVQPKAEEESESEPMAVSVAASQASKDVVQWPAENGNGNGVNAGNAVETERDEKSQAGHDEDSDRVYKVHENSSSIESEHATGVTAVTNAAAAAANVSASSEEEVEVFTMAAEEEAEAEVDGHDNGNGGAQNNGESGSGAAPEAGPLNPNPTQASSWTPQEVEAFFHSKGLVEEGTVFREQEIDGVALLMMRREDIVHGMKFLLGPALKIYRLILELQQVV